MDHPSRRTSETTIANLERSIETFESVVDKARLNGEDAVVARLEALLVEAKHRLERLRAPGAQMRAPADTPSRPTRAVIVDDHELSREAIRSVLRPDRGFVVVGEAADGEEALRVLRDSRPDVVVMDIQMPRLDGLSATRAALAETPDLAIVILTSYEDRSLVMEALRAGAAGYLLKGATTHEVIETLQGAIAGQRRVQASLAATLLTNEAGSSIGTGNVSLSDRELEILQLLAQGHTNEAIGHQLSLSVNTVKTHVRHILQKLESVDRAQAVARAASLGLLRSASSIEGSPDRVT